MDKKLKLYVWENSLIDYTAGVMFALAEDLESAKRLIIAKEGELDSVMRDLSKEPRVITEPEGFAVWGGG